MKLSKMRAMSDGTVLHKVVVRDDDVFETAWLMTFKPEEGRDDGLRPPQE